MAFGLGMDSLGGKILQGASPLGGPLLKGLGQAADRRFLGPAAGALEAGHDKPHPMLNQMQFGE